MKSLKNYLIKGAVFTSILGTLFHFLYAWTGENSAVGLFTPVNESTWEHMKLVFFPILIFSLYKRKLLKLTYPCKSSAFFCGALVGTYLIPVLFYTYSGILGFNLAVFDIATFFISVIISFYVIYKLTLSCKKEKHEKLLKVLCIIQAILFILFTFFPPNIALFISPV